MSMMDQEDENLKMALRQQHESPEPKRSKPLENSGVGGDVKLPEESSEVKNRRRQRELMAAAAERRMVEAKNSASVTVKNEERVKDVKIAAKNVESLKDVEIGVSQDSKGKGDVSMEETEDRSGMSGSSLSIIEADELFLMIFGNRVSKDVLAQWCNQGIRFSADQGTSMGLVQHEGGPCGVLAAIQAFVLKNLLFSPEDSDNTSYQRMPVHDVFQSLSDGSKSRALIRSMSEILFLCGRRERALIASLNVLDGDFLQATHGPDDEVIAKVFGGLSIESGTDLQKVLRIDICTSQSTAFQKLESMLPVFRSRMGALLFLISALLSRGLENVQEDRDDPSQPLVTAPFGHASQEIVNLLLSGSAVANVFDGKMDLGGGMFVKGITTTVEVGFLTLLESLNFCKVGQLLKCPKWPIWVVGSESHYTVLFALDTKVQEENEFESRESHIRRAFDAQDQSGGGGFISVEGFHHVVREANINLPPEKVDSLCSPGFIVWTEFWQALLDLDKSSGGMKDSTGLMGKKVFDLYHFNGIAKSITNGGSSSQSSGSECPVQRPRLTKLRVSVPPRWTPEEFMAESNNNNPQPPTQHAPLVDCIRTRWARAVCNWDGDAPSIV